MQNMNPKVLKGRMLSNVKLLNTNLELKIGQLVSLTPCTNLPPDPKDVYFARPWIVPTGESFAWGEDYSIAISEADVKVLN